MNHKRSGQGAVERLAKRHYDQTAKDAKAQQAAGLTPKQPSYKDSMAKAQSIAKKHDHKRG